MAGILDYLRLLRLSQSYKNLLVFLAVFFSFNIFNAQMLSTTIIGFFALTLTSFSGYIINDIIDREKDSMHPEKSRRVIAAGIVPVSHALTISIILLAVALLTALTLSTAFFFACALLFILTLFYSLKAREIIFLDILVIATNFVLRAIAGAILINVYVSPWLILCPFFLSLFLSIGKRKAEYNTLKSLASRTRKSLKHYNNELTNALMIISTTTLILSYALYTQATNHWLTLTLPVVLYGIFRYFYLIFTNSPVARNPEKAFLDKPLITSMLIWLALAFVILYY
ncbi:decaprenyl-phosphate phosphoribosyltransferase [Candidatus Woesearchaeota archaeon]|nr:MAG: decaprenyl-phosphate phosphoribosyltransferase [Candidatus Woesearchaeota archaeon]